MEAMTEEDLLSARWRTVYNRAVTRGPHGVPTRQVPDHAAKSASNSPVSLTLEGGTLIDPDSARVPTRRRNSG